VNYLNDIGRFSMPLSQFKFQKVFQSAFGSFYLRAQHRFAADIHRHK